MPCPVFPWVLLPVNSNTADKPNKAVDTWGGLALSFACPSAFVGPNNTVDTWGLASRLASSSVVVDQNNAVDTWGGLAAKLASSSLSMPWRSAILCSWASHPSAAARFIPAADAPALGPSWSPGPANNTGAVFTLVRGESSASLVPTFLPSNELPATLGSSMLSGTSLGFL
jgi:hypothetical protein